jgi:hypothetical protein
MTTLARMIGMDVPPIDLGTCTVDPPLQRACRVS